MICLVAHSLYIRDLHLELKVRAPKIIISILLFYSCELHCMYFSTSGGREVTTKRQLDGLCSLLKLTSHIPMFQDY